MRLSKMNRGLWTHQTSMGKKQAEKAIQNSNCFFLEREHDTEDTARNHRKPFSVKTRP
jgi:hypothetical protein